MRSLKIFALAAAGLAVLATGHARAADLPPMLPPPPVIQEYGGWYLRGDIGMTNQKVRFRWDITGFAGTSVSIAVKRGSTVLTLGPTEPVIRGSMTIRQRSPSGC
jgi:opacity protein-like surface antigen